MAWWPAVWCGSTERGGYGFIAPDHGGEDVFLHVTNLEIPESFVRSGLAVEFEIENSNRGPRRPVSGSPRMRQATRSLRHWPRHRCAADPPCEVLSRDEYHHEVTEALLAAIPGLTG
ncbi:cold shock domain-containing protein [Streptomyces sp. NPDC056638]|uniref:cold shock domain-containing protein n=1 Tax=Streptomyces sp. NPDC056638 TaxID=3345887 RepID=UPI00369DF4F1